MNENESNNAEEEILDKLETMYNESDNKEEVLETIATILDESDEEEALEKLETLVNENNSGKEVDLVKLEKQVDAKAAKNKKNKTPRQKELRQLEIAVGAFALVGLILAIVGFCTGAYGLGIVGLLFIPGAAGGAFMWYRELNLKYCRECGEPYDYEKDVEWHETGSEVKEVGNEGEVENRTYVEITCLCRNCGKERSFVRRFTTGKLSKTGKISHTNLEPQIRRIFVKKKR